MAKQDYYSKMLMYANHLGYGSPVLAWQEMMQKVFKERFKNEYPKVKIEIEIKHHKDKIAELRDLQYKWSDPRHYDKRIIAECRSKISYSQTIIKSLNARSKH